MSQNESPNIVLILADDMGIGDVGCYNPASRIPTPNIDALAAEGIVFTDAHSPSAVCTPSRYGILTGRYCWRTRLTRRVHFGYEPPLIGSERLTIARMLQSAGYETGCIGKWHLGLGYQTLPGQVIDFSEPLPWSHPDRTTEEKIDFAAPLQGGPVDLGFDYFFGTSGCSTAQPPFGFIEGDRFTRPPSEYLEKVFISGNPGMASPGWSHENADPEFARRAVRFIENQAGGQKPFFLYLAASAPHEPCVDQVVPEFARGRSDAGPRGDLVWLFDWMVGEVLEALDRKGQTNNTLVIVTSDNGALPGNQVLDENGKRTFQTHDHRPSMDYRGWKSHIWEGGHREPLVARWPGRIPEGATSDQLCSLGDFMATCADLVGVDLPDGAAEDSVTLLPALVATEPLGEPIRRDVIHHSANGVFSIRRDDWKLILETKGSGGWPPPRGGGPELGTPGQLYNLNDDPGESRDLFELETEVVHELSRLVADYRFGNQRS